MRLITGRTLGVCVALAAGAYASMASADEPAHSAQGTVLHGTGTFEQQHLNIDLDSAVTVAGCTGITLQRGEFRADSQLNSPAPCTAAQFIGATFSAVDNPQLTFTLHSARPHENIYSECMPTGFPGLADEGWEYEVTWSQGAQGGELCPGNNLALAVPLAWQQGLSLTDWKLAPSGHAFTFACIPRQTDKCAYEGGGVIAKCTDWGYPPWEPSLSGVALTGHSLVGTTTAGHPLLGGIHQAFSFHQACLSMGTADYCGTGQSNTFDGTPIAFADLISVPVEQDSMGSEFVARRISSPSGDLHFEAAWVDCAAGGQVVPNSACDSLSSIRLGRFGALCLTKKRWASLPVAQSCFDPKAVQESSDPYSPSKFCEDYKESELEALGARFFSFSRFLDVGLYRFGSLASVQGALTTTAYTVNEKAVLPSVLPDFVKLGLQTSSTSAWFEGVILGTHAAEALKGQVPLKALYRCVYEDGGTRRYLTNVSGTGVPADACAPLPGAKLDTHGASDTSRALEGHVTATPYGFSQTPLYLWTDGKKNFRTSTSSPGLLWVSTLLGYIPGNP